MSIPSLKTTLKDLLYKDLTHSWSLSSFAKITHEIHPDWLPRKLPVSMHSRFSHVIYNCIAVNRAPFRSWLHKIKRADSKQCDLDANVMRLHCTLYLIALLLILND